MDKYPQLRDSTIGPYSIRLKRVMYCCFKQSSSSRCVRSHASLFTKWLLLSNTTAHTTSFTRPGKCARYARCMVSSPGQGGQTPRHLPLHHPPMLYFLLPVDPMSADLRLSRPTAAIQASLCPQADLQNSPQGERGRQNSQMRHQRSVRRPHSAHAA